MPLKRAVTEFGKTYKDRFALRTYPGTSVPIFIFILGWSRTKPRVTLSAQTMRHGRNALVSLWKLGWVLFRARVFLVAQLGFKCSFNFRQEVLGIKNHVRGL